MTLSALEGKVVYLDRRSAGSGGCYAMRAALTELLAREAFSDAHAPAIAGDFEPSGDFGGAYAYLATLSGSFD